MCYLQKSIWNQQSEVVPPKFCLESTTLCSKSTNNHTISTKLPLKSTPKNRIPNNLFKINKSKSDINKYCCNTYKTISEINKVMRYLHQLVLTSTTHNCTATRLFEINQ